MGPSTTRSPSKPPTQQPAASLAPAPPPAPLSTSPQPASASAPPLPPPPPPHTSTNLRPVSRNPTVLHVAPSQHSQPQPPILLVGISGSPSSGKTTLSHLLANIFPSRTIPFVLHEADFLLPKHLLETEDADYRATIDFDALIRTLREVKWEGRLPADWRTLLPAETEGADAGQLVGPEVVEELRRDVADRLGLAGGEGKIGIVDGVFLYHDPIIREMLDVKLFLQASKAVAKDRRFGRPESGTPAVKEFRPTPKYFDRVAWPNHVKANGYLFKHADVGGPIKRRVCRELEIDMQPEVDGSMEETLRWAVHVIVRGLEGKNEKSISLDSRELDDRYEICHCREGILGRIRQFLFDFL